MTKTTHLILTVVGVIALGGAFGLNIMYLTLQDKPKSAQISMGTFGSLINLAVVLGLMYTIFIDEPFREKWKIALLLSILFIGLLVEFWLLTLDPEFASQTSVSAYIVLCLNTIVRLFILISARCNTTVIETVVQAASEAGKDLSTIELNNVWSKSISLFDNTLKSTTKTDEEKLELMNKFRAAFGKEPRLPREGPKGGYRR